VYQGKQLRTGKEFKIDVGYERFLGPEIFFSPEIYDEQFEDTLPDLVNDTILDCPIDTRRELFKFITLSGGSTMFKHFRKRLERDVRKRVETKYDEQKAKLLAVNPNCALPKKLEVNVITPMFQRFAVWLGGSLLAEQGEFRHMFHTRAAYKEVGPRIARHNASCQSILNN